MSAARLVALTAAIFVLSGCSVSKPPPGTGGTDVEPAGQCGRGVVVVNTDYQSSNVSLVGLDGEVLSSSFISSASTSVGLSAPLTGDVDVATAGVDGDSIVLIDRFPAAVLSWVDVASAEVRAQLSVATGFTSNPRDYVQVSSGKAYVPRFEPNFDPGAEVFDRGSDVLIVDPRVPEVVGSIDMNLAMGGENDRFFPRPDKLLVFGKRLYVLLAGFSRDFVASAESRLVVIDTETDELVQTFVLSGLHGCAGLAASPDGTEIAVACSGDFEGDSVATLDGSAVAILHVGEELRETRRFLALEHFEGAVGFWVTYADDTRLAVTTFGRFAGGGLDAVDDTLVEVDTQSGETEVLLRSSGEAFSLGEIRCVCATCFLADAERNVVHHFRVGSEGLKNRREIVVDSSIGLPPRFIGGF